MKQKKQKGAWKRTLASFLGLVMVVLLTVAGTLAFLHTKSNERTNVFTSTNDIKLHLDEPNYNLRETINANGTSTYTVKDSNELDPREYVPGMTYPKDPTLYNITGKQQKKSDNSDELAEEWVAMRVDYAIDDDDAATTDDSKTYADMIKDYDTIDSTGTRGKGGIIEKIKFDGTEDNGTEIATPTAFGDWIKLPKSLYSSGAKYDIYVYKYKLKADENVKIEDSDTVENIESMLKNNAQVRTDSGGNVTLGSKTSPLFSEVQIKTKEQLEKNGYEIATLNKFTIKVTGAAVKNLVTINQDEIVAGNILKADNSINTETKSGLIVNDLIELLQ